MTDSHEVAWAAGFFDGEGWTTTIRRQNGRYLHLGIGQKECTTLERFVLAVGDGKIYGPYDKGCPMYEVRVYGRKAKAVIETLWPYLSEPKRKQAQAALEATTGIGDTGLASRRKTHCPQGHPYDEVNTLRWKGQRLCKTCRALRAHLYYEARKSLDLTD